MRLTIRTMIPAIILTAVTLTTPLPAADTPQEPKPICLCNRALGGGQLNSNTPGITDGIGVNNIGLLVKTWGTVTYVDTIQKFFYIDDGSKLSDKCGITAATGIRVSYEGLAQDNTFSPPTQGQFVVITGISSTTQVQPAQGTTRIITTLRPRRQADMIALP